MSKNVVCPECFEGACADCIGPGCYCDCQIPDDPDFEDTPLYDEEDEDRPIDQIHCKDCGRPMIVWADVPLKESDLTCSRCKQGLAPEWEY